VSRWILDVSANSSWYVCMYVFLLVDGLVMKRFQLEKKNSVCRLIQQLFIYCQLRALLILQSNFEISMKERER
jgi:hypothetical protein